MYFIGANIWAKRGSGLYMVFSCSLMSENVLRFVWLFKILNLFLCEFDVNAAYKHRVSFAITVYRGSTYQ